MIPNNFQILQSGRSRFGHINGSMNVGVKTNILYANNDLAIEFLVP
jgi:hypothetical protein